MERGVNLRERVLSHIDKYCTMPFVKPAENYSKAELYDLIERVKGGDQSIVYELVVFTLAESRGIWHGRARAKICRYLKNHPPDATLQSKLVDTIISRLQSGCFAEQFRDQLRTAIRFAPERMHAVALSLQSSEKEHVRRYAAWVLQFIATHGALANNPVSRSRRRRRF